MSWRTLMHASRTHGENLQGSKKTVSIVAKALKKDSEAPKRGSFVNIVTMAGRYKDLKRDDYLPFIIGDKVNYRIPDPQLPGPSPAWVQHSGQILQIDSFAEMILIQSNDEYSITWRWIWTGYAQKMNDGQA